MMALHPAAMPPPSHITTDTINGWSHKDGAYPAVVEYQWKEECADVGIPNWPWVLAWASVVTNHFRDPRWLHEVKLPHPTDGTWPDKGSQTMRMEVRILCRRIAVALNTRTPIVSQADADAEYARLVDSTKADEDSHRPVPTPQPPAPVPPAPPSEPTPKPVGGTPAWVKKIAAYASILLPIISVALYFAPLPQPVKDLIKMLLGFLTGMGGGE